MSLACTHSFLGDIAGKGNEMVEKLKVNQVPSEAGHKLERALKSFERRSLNLNLSQQTQ
jgi:hypothetical protein